MAFPVSRADAGWGCLALRQPDLATVKTHCKPL